MNDLVEVVAKVINDEGGQPDHGLHSWRCSYPDRYGKCDCVEQVAAEIVAAVEPVIRERIAQAIEARLTEMHSDWSNPRYGEAVRIAREGGRDARS